MAFGTLRDHVRHQRFAAGAFPRRLRRWRQRNNLSQSEAALKLQISKRTLQEREQGRAAPGGVARTAIEKPMGGERIRKVERYHSLLTMASRLRARSALRM